MDDLHKLIELDIYFKYYENYKRYISCIKKHYDSLLEVKRKIVETTFSRGYEAELKVKYTEALDEVEKENEIINSSFKDYDFSMERVKENLNDFKILSYKYAKKNLLKSIDTQIKKYGKFKDEKNFIFYLNKIEQLIWDFFYGSFSLNDDNIRSVFDKAKNDIIQGEAINFIE